MDKRVTVNSCQVVQLNRIGDREGHITVIENSQEIPFEVTRVFYIYDIPGGESRGAHAHRECHQFIIAASGSLQVNLDDGISRKVVRLNQPYHGLHIPPGIWASETDFSGGAVCLVLTSHKFEEADYVRDYNEFLQSKR